MIISRLILKNWKNFREADVQLMDRVFVVGPNAAGKSNLLDVFRFLRDIAKTGGGLQEAVKNRGGVSKIRCLAAKRQTDIEIEVHLSENTEQPVLWKYAIGFTQTGSALLGLRAKLRFEKVWDKMGKLIVNRPEEPDKKDEKLLEYTWLEQPTSNADFREIATFFEGIEYLHIIPQLLRDPDSYTKTINREDFYGRNFIEKINSTNKKTRNAFLTRIEKALQLAVPQFRELDLVKDKMGIPHLQAIYTHWRPKGAKQGEDQFSDGTLRLMGLLWALLEGTKPLLLEEPELSLHSGIVSQLAEVIYKLQKKKIGKRQVILSTHSYDLLSNQGISGEEVLMLIPTNEGTKVKNASTDKEIFTLLGSGMSIADAILPKTTPRNAHKLSIQPQLFETDSLKIPQ